MNNFVDRYTDAIVNDSTLQGSVPHPDVSERINNILAIKRVMICCPIDGNVTAANGSTLLHMDHLVCSPCFLLHALDPCIG